MSEPSLPERPAIWPPPVPERARKPRGWLSGPRFSLRRSVSFGAAGLNRLLARLPPGRWVHRWLSPRAHFVEVEVRLRRGDAALDGLRVAFLSDIHAGSYMNERDLLGIFRDVAAIAPDLVCLGGDLINTRDREILMYREALPLLDPPLGIYAVPGNHDHFWGRDLGLWMPFLREQGVEVLVNRGLRVERGGAALWLAGVDDLTEGEPNLTEALRGSGPEEPVLLLSHHPDMFHEASQVGIDLTLSGHTHGGQVKLFGWPPVKHSHFGYLEGRFEAAGAQLYVGRGVGVTLLPLRFGAPAEIPIVTLRV